ncbi:hypothetical protein XELAEV_18027412mg [Xenopus laevis]|uniref:Uncharacterized protein n=1 Tax=Xenopus laevis TaxID=8355 RepID=A0A974HJM3_XENLA|nr:hypothetical protein XELAEV_18027412mg [Xenopus laevis]
MRVEKEGAHIHCTEQLTAIIVNPELDMLSLLDPFMGLYLTNLCNQSPMFLSFRIKYTQLSNNSLFSAIACQSPLFICFILKHTHSY